MKMRSCPNKAKRNNSSAKNIVIGCYAQLKPFEISNIPGVDLVLGANEKFNVVEYIEDLKNNDKPLVHSCNINDIETYESSYSVDDRTRSFLKVQDGCDYKCTYCIIPRARGFSRSDSLENIKDNISKIASKGVKEIILTGVNIGDYGKGEYGNKKHKSTFFDLIKELDKSMGIERLRISSVEPNLLKNEIIDFISQSNLFVPHFHIPLQSGSNKILGLMKRRYQKELYQKKIEYINRKIDNVCIGVDVIVGFPGETEEDFQQTYHFLKSLESRMLRSLSEKKSRAFYDSQLNSKRIVLYESENKYGYIHGYTDNYVKVRTPWDPKLSNKLVYSKLKNIDDEGFMRTEMIIQNKNFKQVSYSDAHG